MKHGFATAISSHLCLLAHRASKNNKGGKGKPVCVSEGEREREGERGREREREGRVGGR